MREYSILFSAPMVQALRAERKTQARRTRGLDKINEAPDAWAVINNEFDRNGFAHFRYMLDSRDDVWIRCPYGVGGDRSLWTRESLDTLEVISARPERLHDMTRADAYAEGITAGDSFPNLWNSINGPGSWAKNPWVWRVEFRRISL